MESFATPYPLIFFDGDQEKDKGFIGIHSVMTFKRFQSLLSQKTGIPPNQLSTVFVCRKAFKGLEKKQRLPITGNTNFNILLNQHNPNKERDCYFLVSLKKSKKERKGTRKRGAESEVPDDWEFNLANVLERREHITNVVLEDTLSQGSAGSSCAVEANGSPFSTSKSIVSKPSVDGVVGSSQATDKMSSRVILKRGNASIFQRQAWNRGDLQASHLIGGKAVDEFVQLQSPRFAALRPEDQRDINWRWEDHFPRAREQWEQAFYTFPPNATGEADLDFYPCSSDSFNVLHPEDQVSSSVRRKGGLLDSYNNLLLRNASPGKAISLGMYKNRGFAYPKPNLYKPRTSTLSALEGSRESDLRKIQDPFMERELHFHYLSQGAWQKMPGISGATGDFHDEPRSIDGWMHDEGTHNFFCQLCFECKKRNVSPIPFHWCVEDAVTKGFRGPSPAGPIARRAKTCHVAATA